MEEAEAELDDMAADNAVVSKLALAANFRRPKNGQLLTTALGKIKNEQRNEFGIVADDPTSMATAVEQHNSVGFYFT